MTQAISQTLICKVLRIDSPSHAQMTKQRHKTWPFCLKYYILSKSNKIQTGGWYFSSMTVFVGQNRPRPLAWDQEMTPCKQMETMIIPTSLRSKTLFFSHKMKDAPLKCMIRI